MKKLIFMAAAAASLVSINSFAQSGTKNALGLRFGGNSGLGTEISYQRDLTKNNRLELDLGFRNNNNFNATKLTGIYEWVWNIDGSFNWYAGPGVAIGTYSHKHHDSGTFALITGTIGIEYTFDIPLQISLDLRPEIYLNDSYRDGLYTDLGLAIRYKF